MDRTKRLSGVKEVFAQRRTFPVTVAVVSNQHSFCAGKKTDINLFSVNRHTLRQPALNGRDYICHRRAVLSQVTDKLRFCKIVVPASVSES